MVIMSELRFHIRTYGCQMNERDSEALSCLLSNEGWVGVADEEAADIILLNTCSVRDRAERKALGKVGFLKRLKRRKPDLIIGVIGCMAQNLGESLLESMPHVDLVVGTDRLHELPWLLREVLRKRQPLVRTGTGQEVLGALHQHDHGRTTAYVSVMRGCNQFCTYCIVPYVRGREKSRTVDQVLSEVCDVVGHGTREIFLLGQNITAYGIAELKAAGLYMGKESPFAELLRAIDATPGVERIRFTSPHPRFMNAAFIEAIVTLPKVCESFHVPLQSGSARILKAMGRGYTPAEYLDRISSIKSALPPVTFSTDVIVGFPGETEADFEATRQLMDEVGFDMAYIFKYSPRAGTKAAGWVDDVPQAVKEERNQILLADLEARTLTRNRSYLGQRVQVLVEGESKRNPQRWTGRSRTNKVCLFSPDKMVNVGDLADIMVERVTANSLFGRLI